MRRRPAVMLRRGLPNDEAELRPDGPEVVARDGDENWVGSMMSNKVCDSGRVSSKGRHANDNERLYEYLVSAGRRGDGKKIAAAKAASADAKRLQRNKRAREKRQEEKRLTVAVKQGAEERKLTKSEDGEEEEKHEGQNEFTKEQTEFHEKKISNFTAAWPEDL